ncbi:MAG: phosphatidylserine decarboxylase [Thermoplasmatota archaeon]
MLRLARGGAGWLLFPPALTLVIAVTAAVTHETWILWFALPLALLFVFLLAFFRDPERPGVQGDDAIASPADGRVFAVDQVEDPDVGAADRLAIFMHPRDVHVNRVPLSGDVVAVRHLPGKHIPAFDKDSERNERVETLLRMPDGSPVKVVQIAGAVARRVVPYLKAGQHVARGDRLGLIRLGSRCDLIVPRGRVEWSAPVGEQVYGSKTTVGRWRSGGVPPG